MARVGPFTIIHAEKRVVVFCSHPKTTDENALHGGYEGNDDVLLPNYTDCRALPPLSWDMGIPCDKIAGLILVA